MRTAVVWSCLPLIRSGQNHLARHSEKGKETRQTEEEVGRQHQGMDRPGVWQVSEGSGKQGKMEKTGCKIICSTPTTLVVKGLLMMMMMMMNLKLKFHDQMMMMMMIIDRGSWHVGLTSTPSRSSVRRFFSSPQSKPAQTRRVPVSLSFAQRHTSRSLLTLELSPTSIFGLVEA